jgi:tetratricopeptide (TPR) repeat protein
MLCLVSMKRQVEWYREEGIALRAGGSGRSSGPVGSGVGQVAIGVLLLLIVYGSMDVRAQVGSLSGRLERAVRLISENQIVEAEQELTGILKVSPNQPAALNLLGTIRAKQSRLNEAETLFRRAVQSDKRYVGPRMNLAYLYSMTGQPEKTISELREVLQLEPKNAEALDKLARLLMTRGQFEEGIAVLEVAKSSQALPEPLLVLLADAYVKKGNLDKATASYKSALEQQADETDAVLGLAQVSQLKGDAGGAMEYLGRARKMVATTPDTLYRFAIVALRAGLYEEANGTLLAAIKLKPDDASYYLALGNTWIKKPDLAAAEGAFRRALELQPDDPQVQMYLGYTLLEQHNLLEARELLEKSATKDKTVPETFFYLGQIAQELNEDERAIELFKQAIALAPSYSFAHVALGASYIKLKNYPVAQQELELSVKLNPNDSKAHYQLAVLFARLKNQKRSQEELRIVETLKNAEKPGKVEANNSAVSPD